MSDFVVSARKYRPIRFSDVVGQAHVANTLKNALRSNHLAQAFLFTGPRGVGKTTCARILAKVLNCEHPTDDWEACDECASCKAFRENASFNVHELDAASNNSVEHIRALIEQVRFQPQKGKYKIYIIDEVHMLSAAAFNAFLKTLEEPPPYAIFILATTEKHKIIPTILSRCQIFDFNRIQIADMSAHLAHICEEEHITADPDALHIIAQKADGALRDALSIFDRIVSYSGSKISYDDVIQNLNILDYDYYFKITEALLTEDASRLLLLFADILQRGFDTEIFVSGLAEHLRNLLVCRDPATLVLLEAGDSLRERYREQAAVASSSFLLSALDLCNECDVQAKTARNKRLHVELYLLKMCFIERALRAAYEKKKWGSSTDTEHHTGVGSIPNTTASPALVVVPPPTKVAATNVEKTAVPTKTLAEVRREMQAKDEHIAIPKIGELQKQGKQELAEKQTLIDDKTRLTTDALQQHWLGYAEQYLANQAYTQAMMRENLPTLAIAADGQPQAIVVTQATIDGAKLDGDRELLRYLREVLHEPTLALIVTVNATATSDSEAVAATEKPKTLNNTEKIQEMAAKNDAVKLLFEKLDLRII